MRLILTLLSLLTCALVLCAQAPQPVPAPVPLKSLPSSVNGPAVATWLALADARSLPAAQQPYARYLSIYNVALADRADWKAVLDFVLNSLSRRRQLVPSVVVAGSDGTVLRYLTTDYGIDPAELDELAYRGSGPLRQIAKKEKAEPYFYLDVTHEKTVATVFAPWCGPELSALAHLVGAGFPIMRGDWFLYHATLPPAYYDLLGFKTLKDFQQFARFRVQDSVDLASQAIGLDSQEVAQNNRYLLRSPTVLGFYWETGDYFASVDQDDLLADILKRKRDASEIIATGLNGLQYYFLVNGKDERIDFADPNVAADRNTRWRDKLVWTAASCIMCHEHGIKDVADEVRILSRKNIALLVQDPHQYERVQDLFTSDIDASIVADQQLYEREVGACTGGHTSKANTGSFANYFIDYVQGPVSLDMLPAETGYSAETILTTLRRGINLDHSLTGFLQVPPRPARRDQYEATGFPQLMQLLQAGGRP